MLWFIVALGIWNACVLLVYGIDKIKAIRGSWRISEACLLLIALLFGGVGGTAGMLLFRHKIRKPKFLIVYVFAVLDVIAAALICIYVF